MSISPLQSPRTPYSSDSEKDAEAPAKTLFQLSPYLRDFGYLSLLFERGVYKLSPAEGLDPFYPGPTRRIAAFSMPRSFGYLVFLV